MPAGSRARQRARKLDPLVANWTLINTWINFWTPATVVSEAEACFRFRWIRVK